LSSSNWRHGSKSGIPHVNDGVSFKPCTQLKPKIPA
jgi:hypothetical protein